MRKLRALLVKMHLRMRRLELNFHIQENLLIRMKLLILVETLLNIDLVIDMNFTMKTEAQLRLMRKKFQEKLTETLYLKTKTMQKRFNGLTLKMNISRCGI